MSFSKWPCVKITCKPKLLCKCLTSALISHVLKIYFGLHGLEWSSKLWGEGQEPHSGGEKGVGVWTLAHLQIVPQSAGWDSLCNSCAEISLRIQWAYYVDLVLPFEETHAQSGSGKLNAIEKMTDGNLGRSAWLGKTGWSAEKEPRKGSWHSFTAYLPEGLGKSHISMASLALKVYDSENLRRNSSRNLLENVTR